MIRTNTDCNECVHKKVCKMADRPKEVVEHLDMGTLEWRVDDERLDIIVSCKDYMFSGKYSSTPRTANGNF